LAPEPVEDLFNAGQTVLKLAHKTPSGWCEQENFVFFHRQNIPSLAETAANRIAPHGISNWIPQQ
jgi:hypothetical protein